MLNVRQGFEGLLDGIGLEQVEVMRPCVIKTRAFWES